MKMKISFFVIVEQFSMSMIMIMIIAFTKVFFFFFYSPFGVRLVDDGLAEFRLSANIFIKGSWVQTDIPRTLCIPIIKKINIIWMSINWISCWVWMRHPDSQLASQSYETLNAFTHTISNEQKKPQIKQNIEVYSRKTVIDMRNRWLFVINSKNSLFCLCLYVMSECVGERPWNKLGLFSWDLCV